MEHRRGGWSKFVTIESVVTLSRISLLFGDYVNVSNRALQYHININIFILFHLSSRIQFILSHLVLHIVILRQAILSYLSSYYLTSSHLISFYLISILFESSIFIVHLVPISDGPFRLSCIPSSCFSVIWY